nr:substrate-binding domain-containing protein [Lachnospiraceae bacterium]
TAKALGYDFSKLENKYLNPKNKNVCILYYNKHGIFDNPFFFQLQNGIVSTFKRTGYQTTISYIEASENVEAQLEQILSSGCDGLILFATEMTSKDYLPFSDLKIPIVLLDSYIYSENTDCVMINNMDGAYHAADYMIAKRHKQPGYLRSKVRFVNFEEREYGFNKAIVDNGYSTNRTIIHSISGESIISAYEDMKQIINEGDALADCYFADNDIIGMGAMRAFKEAGYDIPKDIGIIGFDNMAASVYEIPPLTTVNVPKEYMGKIAAERMAVLLNEPDSQSVKITINTHLIKRKSI